VVEPPTVISQNLFDMPSDNWRRVVVAMASNQIDLD
jgi:hypothetical protein